MASHRLAWRDLVPGLLAAAAILALCLGVLRFARIGGVKGDTMRLYMATNGARGILPGSEVWLAGVKVGVVREIGFRPPSTDTLRRVVLALDVLEEHQAQFRRDSWAQIRTGSSFVGAEVVWVSPGTPTAPVLAAGDTITSRQQTAPEELTSELAIASRDVPVILDNVRVLTSQLRSAEGTIGALLGTGVTQNAGDVATRVGVVLDRARSGPTAALLQARGPVRARAEAIRARVDTVTALLTADRAAGGGALRDSTLARELTALRAAVAALQWQLAEARGTAGRGLHDEALARELAAIRRELDALIADMKDNPLRYVPF